MDREEQPPSMAKTGMSKKRSPTLDREEQPPSMAKTGMAASSTDTSATKNQAGVQRGGLVHIIKPSLQWQWCGGLQIWHGEESCQADLAELSNDFHHVVIERRSTTQDPNFMVLVSNLRSCTLVELYKKEDLRSMLEAVQNLLDLHSAVKVLFIRSTESEILIAIMLNQLLDFTPRAAKMQIEDKMPVTKFGHRFRLGDLTKAVQMVEFP